jgi:hypothetical protein
MADTPQRSALRIDDSLLQELGLGTLTEFERTSLLKNFYETLELRVGTRLADQMSNEQLDEFERFFNAKDETGAFHWLEDNFPNYKQLVTDEFTKLKNEIAAAHREVTAHVFICYSRNDADIAEQLVKKFQSVGIRVWIDNDHVMPGTSDWELEIRQNIKKSNGVVYVATEEAATSDFVRDELAIARDHHIPVYAIWARGDYWSSSIPLGWGRTHYADGRGDKFDGAVLSIIASLKRARSDS